MFCLKNFILAAGVLLLSFASQGYAAIDQYDLTGFASATSSYTMLTEDFEVVTVSILDQNATGTNSLAFSDFGVTSGLNSLKVMDDPMMYSGRTSFNSGDHNMTLGGKNFLAADTNVQGVGDYMLLTFNQPINAFGLYLVNLADGGTVNINAGAGIYNVLPTVSSSGVGGEFFFGVVSDTPFTTVQLNMGSSDSNWNIDDVQYGTVPVVPEPISSVLFVIGGSVLAGRRFMRKKK